MLSRLRFAALGIVMIACGDQGGTTSERATAPLEPSTRDSAGVTIHEHPDNALERAPLIAMDSVPLTVIGGDDEDNDVSSVFNTALLSDGRVAAFDGRAGALRIFGVDGALLATHGRRGEGPGEFRGGIERLVPMAGDTVLVTDWVSRRVTLVHPDSGMIRIETVPTRGVGQSFVVMGLMADDAWLMAPTSTRLLYRSGGSGRDTTRQQLPIGLYRTGSKAEQLDTIVRQYAPPFVSFKARQGGNTEDVEGPGRYAAWPFGFAWNGMAVSVPNDGWKIHVHDGSGALRTVIRINRSRVPVTEAFKDSMLVAQLETYREALAERPEMAEYQSLEDVEFNARNTAYADSLPPFDRDVPSNGRLLWLSEMRVRQDEPGHLIAIDPEGRIMGRLTVPSDWRVLSMSDDRIVVRTENEDGIARISVRKLVLP